MAAIGINNLQELFQKIAQTIEKNAPELERLDSLMGDGDLGMTMTKGFWGIAGEKYPGGEKSLGKAFMKSGMALSSLVPSTMGFLMGSGLMGAGKRLGEAAELTSQGLLAFLTGYCEGIVKRGKCAPGERTVLDSFHGAKCALEEGLERDPGMDLSTGASLALTGAKKGLEETKTMVPKYGKAAIHSKAAEGVIDQGALAGYLVIQGIAEFVKDEDM